MLKTLNINILTSLTIFSDQTQQHFSIKKQELLAQKEKLLLLIKEKISYLRSNTRAKIS